MTYVPALISERYADPHESGWDSCVYCALAMLADAAIGGPVTTPQALEAIDDPNHTKTGTTMPDGLIALAKAVPAAAHVVVYLSDENDTIDGLLAAGNGLALTGLYGQLPDHFRRWQPSYAGGHAVYVQALGPDGSKPKNVWLLDPLAAQTFSGEWLPTEAMHAFIAGRTQHAYAPIAQGDDMALDYAVVGGGGSFTVKGAGHQLFRLHDPSVRGDLADGRTIAVAARIKLAAPLDAHSGDRQSAVLFLGEDGLSAEAALLVDGVFTPTPPPAPELHVFEATLTVTAPAAPKVVVTQGG